MTNEEKRLEEAREGQAPWKLWGPYLAERAWGTVREDYSPDGSAWSYFPHDHARSRVYRWSEDGIAGISDEHQYLCFAIALWNGKDAILKERLFGLTGDEGNHGEDVKEYYFYLDSSPTHSYMKCLYKYPHRAYPYQELVEENRRRGKGDPEFELIDTGVFDENRYFDVFVEYAKAAPDDIVILISAANRGPESATLHILPTLWFRNTWSWGYNDPHPRLFRSDQTKSSCMTIVAEHPLVGNYSLLCGGNDNGPDLLFTENESNFASLYPPNGRNFTPFVKDGINEYVVRANSEAVNPAGQGTKAAAYYSVTIGPEETKSIRLRLMTDVRRDALEASFDDILELRRSECDEFFETVAPAGISQDAKNIQRRAVAGLLWSKQYYHYNVNHWLTGDPAQPAPPEERWKGRNHNWKHLNNSEVISMPDKWEYPWYAAWDLAFHCVALALVDSDFAKDQMIMLLREWFMHPSGQLPAYEWEFGDVNPPVHAWASLRIYQIERRLRGTGDCSFLERVFHKLLINFTWWVNRKDAEGRNVFQGGFLGLDNIGIFDRSAPIPGGGHIDQSDGTSWMAMYCLNMLAIALELARQDSDYEDVAVKFLEHFFYIAHAMNDRPAVRGDDGVDLWDEEDGFYYDVLHTGDGGHFFLRVRSLVGLIPLFAVETLDGALLDRLPEFRKRLGWFLRNRPDLCSSAASVSDPGSGGRRLFSVVNDERLRLVLKRALDESEFLSPFGIRSLSRIHRENPYNLQLDGGSYEVGYEPAESTTGMFGGNSNWRGPIWFPLNYLLIESLQKHDYYYGSEFKVEHPAGSGNMLTLWEVSQDLSRRLIRLFLRDRQGRRPVFGTQELFQTDPHWRDNIPFHEYFHGDNGTGLGASHQTGWTALVAKLIQQSGEGLD